MKARALLQSRLMNDPAFALSVSVALAAGIAALDYATDYELRFGVLYVPPVLLAAWGAGFPAAVGISLASAALWLVTLFVKHPYEHAFAHVWESGLHLAMYVAFAYVATRLKETLRLADQRFVSAFNSLDAAACVVDPENGRLLYVNAPFRRIFAAGARLPSAAELARRFGVMAPDALAEGEGFDMDSGRWFYILCRAMRWLDGRSVRLYVASDITENKRAEGLARKQEEQLQRTARLIAVGEMASTLAHELNQPLGAIANYNNGCIRLLRSGSPDAAQLLQLMEKCSTQAMRAGDVVRRIREFVRQRPPDLRPEEPGAMIAEALSAASSEHPEPVELRMELEPGLPRVAADRMMVEKVMVNLARNAIDSMQQVAPHDRCLVVRACAEAGRVQIEFRDRGCGLPADVESHIFQPFLTTKPDGMGLGLAICRSIVEYHRGELWFRRNPEGGSTFCFTLPVALS